MVKFPGHTTVLMGASAAGKMLPPLIIFEGGCPSQLSDVSKDWTFTATKSGYINSDIFYTWFISSFVPNCGRKRPVLLVMDNHVSHISPRVIDAAKGENIELLCFPPHSTHLLQPMDRGYFNVLKQNMANSAVQLGYGGMKCVPKHLFPRVLRYAMGNIKTEVILSAFRTSLNVLFWIHLP